MGPATVADKVMVAEAVEAVLALLSAFMEDTLFSGRCVGVATLQDLVNEADRFRKVTAAAATLEEV